MNRTDVLNYLVSKYNLKRYLEIGVQDTAQNFDKIKCSYKISVDPDPNAKATFVGDSDTFFKCCDKQETFDLIFIDGLHTAEQVKKDFENALKILSPHGFIVLHDCNPIKEEHTIVPRPTKSGHWNGDVYRFAVTVWAWQKVTIDIDNGCMVVHPMDEKCFDNSYSNIDWSYFNKYRKELLHLISWDEFVKM